MLDKFPLDRNPGVLVCVLSDNESTLHIRLGIFEQEPTKTRLRIDWSTKMP
jgi:hypothetical protein